MGGLVLAEGQDPSLLRLKELSAELKSMDVKVVGVTTVIPQVNRAAIERAGGFPFPLVSDIDPQSAEGLLRIHRHWGRFDPTREKPLEGIFLVNRSGQVPYVGQVPQPAENVEQVYELLKK